MPNQNDELEYDGDGEDQAPPKKDVPQNPAMAAKIAARRQATSNRNKNYALAFLGLLFSGLLAWTVLKEVSGDSSAKPAVVAGTAAPAVGELGAPAPLVPTQSGGNSGSSAAQPPQSAIVDDRQRTITVFCRNPKGCVQGCSRMLSEKDSNGNIVFDGYICLPQLDQRPIAYYGGGRRGGNGGGGGTNPPIPPVPYSQETPRPSQGGGGIDLNAVLGGTGTSAGSL